MINYSKVPVDYMVPGLRRYIEAGIEPGGFLYALLCNDLFGAVARADCDNKKRLVQWCQFIYNELPAGCWGSEENVAAWMRKTVCQKSAHGSSSSK